MEAKKDNKEVAIILSEDEALVLLEWLTKFNEKEDSSLFEDRQAEQRILFDLEASLERVVSETFKGNYIELLSKARQKIRDTE